MRVCSGYKLRTPASALLAGAKLQPESMAAFHRVRVRTQIALHGGQWVHLCVGPFLPLRGITLSGVGQRTVLIRVPPPGDDDNVITCRWIRLAISETEYLPKCTCCLFSCLWTLALGVGLTQFMKTYIHQLFSLCYKRDTCLFWKFKVLQMNKREKIESA